MIRAVIFDCFGVLLADKLQLMLDELAVEKPDVAEEARNLVRAVNKGTLNPRETRAQIAACFGLSMEDYVKKLRAGEVKNEQLMHYILKLRKQHKTAVLSNIGADSLRKRFTPSELDNHFDVVVASGDIGHAKPEAEAYTITAERLSLLPEECVFTDDREMFCDAATSVNMHAIVYTNFAQFTKELDTLLARENS